MSVADKMSSCTLFLVLSHLLPLCDPLISLGEIRGWDNGLHMNRQCGSYQTACYTVQSGNLRNTGMRHSALLLSLPAVVTYCKDGSVIFKFNKTSGEHMFEYWPLGEMCDERVGQWMVHFIPVKNCICCSMFCAATCSSRAALDLICNYWNAVLQFTRLIPITTFFQPSKLARLIKHHTLKIHMFCNLLYNTFCCMNHK